MAHRRNSKTQTLGSILSGAGGDLQAFSQAQSQGSTTAQAECLGSGGTWDERTKTCKGGSPTLQSDSETVHVGNFPGNDVRRRR